MSKVFLIEEPRAGINVEAATEFGTLRIVFGKNDRRSSVFKVNAFGRDVINRLKSLGFDHEVDSLVMTGGLIQVSLMAIAATCTYPFVRLLFYNATQDEYTLRVLNKNDWKGCDEKTGTNSVVANAGDESVSREDVRIRPKD